LKSAITLVSLARDCRFVMGFVKKRRGCISGSTTSLPPLADGRERFYWTGKGPISARRRRQLESLETATAPPASAERRVAARQAGGGKSAEGWEELGKNPCQSPPDVQSVRQKKKSPSKKEDEPLLHRRPAAGVALQSVSGCAPVLGKR
jgi:hypothetical protein